MRNKLAESSVDSASRHDESSSHLGNIVGHELDLVIEDGTDASGHDGGWLGVCDAAAGQGEHEEIWICFKRLEIRLSNVGEAALRWYRVPRAEESQNLAKGKECQNLLRAASHRATEMLSRGDSDRQILSQWLTGRSFRTQSTKTLFGLRSELSIRELVTTGVQSLEIEDGYWQVAEKELGRVLGSV